MEQAKRIPYGVSNFVDIVERNQYYVDKTMYLPMLENEADSLFFIRPRRFGKSLFISMMQAYYDIDKKDRFQELFGNLWIGSHPTENQGKFQVLYLDFSRIGGDISDLQERFDEYCGMCIDFFVEQKYRKYYEESTVLSVKAAKRTSAKLNAINLEASQKGYKLYLIIDEYDNFTNVVLNEHGEKVYWALTHASGFYREIFKVFKGMFARIFMTGVSPVTLDDMIAYYQRIGKISADADVDAIVADMKPWYDNYCFSEDALRTQSKVFNCDMVLYYLRNYMETNQAPRQMIDPNTKTDYNKMKKLLQLDKLDGDRKGIINEIAERGEILGNIETSFPAKMLVQPQMFVSLLFYYGMLTIKGTRGDRLILGIPNNNVRKQYYEYLMEQYEEKAPVDTYKLGDYFYDMAYDGKWREGLEFMAAAYAKVSSVRDGIEAERNLQGFFMAYLSLNNYYYTAPELELNHGYCDFFLLPNLTHYASKHCYIIELKLIPKRAKGMSEEDYNKLIAQQWEDAKEQIKGYAAAPRVETLRQGTQLHRIIMQFDGYKLHRLDEV